MNFKRILALGSCAALLTTGCAMAAESRELKISNLQLTLGESQAIDLSGVELTLGAGANEAGFAGFLAELGANGEAVMDLVTAVNAQEALFSLTGLTNTYSVNFTDIAEQAQLQAGAAEVVNPAGAFNFSEADLTALADLGTQLTALVPTEPSSTTEGADGTVNEYDIEITEAQTAELLNSLSAMLDNHPELFQNSEYANFSEYLATLGLKLSISGKVTESATGNVADINLTASTATSTEPETINFYAEQNKETNAETGEELTTVDVVISKPDGENYDVLENVSMSMLKNNGEFYGCDLQIADASGAGIMIAVYAPVYQGYNLWQYSLVTLDQSIDATVLVSPADAETDSYSFELNSSDGSKFVAAYEGKDGAGQIEVFLNANGTAMDLLADVAVTTGDGAWLPTTAEGAVDMMKLDAEQQQNLMIEGSAAALNALHKLAEANPTIASLVNAMMGGTATEGAPATDAEAEAAPVAPGTEVDGTAEAPEADVVPEATQAAN